VFFLADKGENFGFVQDLILRLKMKDMVMPFEPYVVTMAPSLRTLVLRPFDVI
jgi:hypothetical protein